MDLFIDRDELSRGLARVQNVVERRSTHPLLGHVLLHARDGGLRITATDTEVAFIGDLAANVTTPGEIAVDAANLFQIARSLPEPTVQLTLGNPTRLDVVSGRARFRLPGFAAEEFPQLPAFDGQSTITVQEGAFRRLVDQTHFAVATEDVRYGLNGVHLEEAKSDEGTRLRMVATDGHRLSAGQIAFEGELSLTPRTLVPRKALAVMRKLLEPRDEPIEVSFGDGAIRLVRPGQTFWFRLLDGEFPDYGSVLPQNHKMQVRIPTADFNASLRRVLIIARDRTRAVKFAFGDGELAIELHSSGGGEVRETLPVEIEGENMVVGFNARFLQDVLAVVRGDAVVLEQSSATAPCMVRDPEDDSAFFVVMPMRLD